MSEARVPKGPSGAQPAAARWQIVLALAILAFVLVRGGLKLRKYLQFRGCNAACDKQVVTVGNPMAGNDLAQCYARCIAEYNR